MILKDETNCIIYKDIEGWDEFPSFIKILKDEQNTIIYKDIEGWDKILSFMKILKDETKFHYL